jgi:hypothetical protein
MWNAVSSLKIEKERICRIPGSVLYVVCVCLVGLSVELILNHNPEHKYLKLNLA